MKYYVISYLWQTAQNSKPLFGTGLVESAKGICGVYEHVIAQPEGWCLTHVCEITKEEYDQAQQDGIIG